MKILIGAKKNQFVLASYCCNQQVKLRQHPAHGTKLAKKLRELSRGVFVGRPQPQDSQGRLEPGQVLAVTFAQPEARSVFAEDR